ncbi:MAG: M48 family metallopeptidase [Angustibacter sp.]
MSTTAAGGRDLITCGRCGHQVPDGGEWTTWCEMCDWNVVTRPEPLGGLVSRWRRRLAHRVGARVYGDLRAGRRPDARDALAHGALLVVSVMVDLAIVASVGLLVVVVLSDSLGFWHWPAVVACLVWLALVLPRPHHLPDEGLVQLSREDAPRLWGLVDDVAAGVGTAPPQVLAVSTDLNAYAMRSGWRWRRTVVMGLPLWAVLGPQEGVATLAHELGHFKSRDIGRGAVVGAAGVALTQVVGVLWPDAFEDEPPDVDLTWLFVAVNLVRRLVALPLVALLYGMERLHARASQRQEYLADIASARVAGAAAAQRALLRLLSLDGTHTRVRSAVRRREDVWTALATAPHPPQHELRRLQRESELVGHQADDTHPPTHLRAQLVADATVTAPAVVVDASRAAALEAELQPVRERLREVLTDSFLE